MTGRKLLVAFAGCVLGGMVALAADDPFTGTWKLNAAKSKIGAGAATNNTVVYAAAGDSVKVTVDGVDGSGKPSHSEWTGKFDGKDYPGHGRRQRRHAVVHQGQRQNAVLLADEGRQGDPEREDCHLGRRQEPDGDD